ncbi:Carboxylesterase NlhH [Caulifigura coniformis]|uniref:Carboxylesterase NlhH n=1 Tax=Caulifigura coniformis TaxID=2527983 RepID=A0A517SI22_9PLAN|nr:alpha/beta hydrolase [Caulifigura coniformis]QDT55773.1 Carboxylesterase NlhH [Caulifigura coniformis]
MRQLVWPLLGVIAALFSSRVAGQDQVAPMVKGSENFNVPYVEFKYRQHERHRLNLVVPARVEGSRLPLVIWIHGGAWREGSKDVWHPARVMYDKGFAVCSINYRLSNSAPFPAQLQDCKAAIRWLRKNADRYGIDPDRIGVWGASAGGHLAALVGTTGDVAQFDIGENLDQSSSVKCVVDYYGPTNFQLMNEQAKGLPGGPALDHDHPNSPESLLLGGPVQRLSAEARRADPCEYVTANDPPFLIIHGQRDPVVAHGQSELLVKSLKEAGIAVDFRSVPRAGHGDGFGDAEQKASEDFLRHHLAPK